MRTVGSRNNKRKIKITKTLKKRNHRLTDSRVKSKLKPNWIQTGGTYDAKKRDQAWLLGVKEIFLQEGEAEELLFHVLDIMAAYGLYKEDTTDLGFNQLTVEDFYDTYRSVNESTNLDKCLTDVLAFCKNYRNPDSRIKVDHITLLFGGLQNAYNNMIFISRNTGIEPGSGTLTSYAIFNFLTKNRYVNELTTKVNIENPLASVLVAYYPDLTPIRQMLSLGFVSLTDDMQRGYSSYRFNLDDADSITLDAHYKELGIDWPGTPIFVSFMTNTPTKPDVQFSNWINGVNPDTWAAGAIQWALPATIFGKNIHEQSANYIFGQNNIPIYNEKQIGIVNAVAESLKQWLIAKYNSIHSSFELYTRFAEIVNEESWIGDGSAFAIFWQTLSKHEGDMAATIRDVTSEIQCEDNPALCVKETEKMDEGGGMDGGRVYKYKVQSARVSNKRAGSHLNRKTRKTRKNKTIQTGGTIENLVNPKTNRIELLTVLFQLLANGISPDDFHNDSTHDGLLSGTANESAWLIQCLADVPSSELYGQFFSLHQTTGIMQADMAKLMQPWNVLRDAGPWSSLALSNVCSNSKFTRRDVSNFVDPAKTGSGLGYLCSDTLVKLFYGNRNANDAAKQDAMTEFIKLCVEYVFSMRGVNLADANSISLVKEYLNGITCTEVGNGYIKCTFTYNRVTTPEFKWEASQSVMAICINWFGGGGAVVRNDGADAGFTDDGFAQPHIIGLFLDFLNAKGVTAVGLRGLAVNLLCRILKYMGDKSHIVAAICLILSQAFAGGKPETKPWFISTHDRMLCKAIIETIAYCENPEAQDEAGVNIAWLLDIIATNLGCIGICWTAVAKRLSGKYSIYESTKVNISGDDVIDGYAYFKPDLSKAFVHEIEQIKQRFIKDNPELTPEQASELIKDANGSAISGFADGNAAIAWLNSWKQTNGSYKAMCARETAIEEGERMAKMGMMVDRVFTAILSVINNTPTRKSSRSLPGEGDIKRLRQLFLYNGLTIRRDNSTDELVEVLQFILEPTTGPNAEMTEVLNRYIPEADALYTGRFSYIAAITGTDYKCTDRDVAMFIVGYTWNSETKTFTLDEVFRKINENSTQVNVSLPVGQRLVLTNLAESYVDNIITAIGLLRRRFPSA